MASQIVELEHRLRDLINAPRRHKQLRADAAKFSQLCSSLDLIEDTEMAFDAYLEPKNGELDIGTSYLHIYGALQALIIQQDATDHIAHSLAIPYTAPSVLSGIREIRNNSVGHPARRGRAPGRAFNHIVQASLTPEGFTLATFDADGHLTTQDIDVPNLIAQQRKAVEAALLEFVELEVTRESEHRIRFRDDPLAAAFPNCVAYYFEKLAEAIYGAPALAMASFFVQQIEDAVGTFEAKLAKRGELDSISEVIEHHTHPARHALRRLREYFECGPRDCLNRDDASAFLSQVVSHLNSLRELAVEIDETYASNPT